MGERDVETAMTSGRFVELLRRAADAIESGEALRIQVGNARFTVPVGTAELGVEHEVDGDAEELAFEIRWKR